MRFFTICIFVVKCLRMRGALCNGIHWVLSILVCMLDAQYTGVYVVGSVYWCVCCWLSMLVCMSNAQFTSVYARCSSILMCMLDAPVY